MMKILYEMSITKLQFMVPMWQLHFDLKKAFVKVFQCKENASYMIEALQQRCPYMPSDFTRF